MAHVSDLLEKNGRKKIIQEIKSRENIDRKSISFRESEVYSNRILQYVTEGLEEAFGFSAARNMPKISSINLAKRIVKEKATIYKEKPRRTYLDATDDQREKIELIYKDMMADTKLMKSNENYKLQEQSLIMLIPILGKLTPRVLRSHQYDVIPNEFNPEIADAYIVSVFDRDNFIENRKNETPSGVVGTSQQYATLNTDGTNQSIGDGDDYQAGLDRYLVWTKFNNFIMDGNGDIVSDNNESPIPGFLPFVDVALNKEFEYFVRESSSMADFTVQYNVYMSDLAHIVRMQGWSQAIIKGDKKLMVNDMTVGVTKILFLPIDKNAPVDTDFKFVNPNPDLDGSIKSMETLLANYLSAEGVDPNTVTGKASAAKFTSGIERLLAMIDKFEASQEDYIIYENVENKLFDLVKLWHNALINKKELDPKYKTELLGEEVTQQTAFKKPEMIQTAQEKLDFYSQKIAMGMSSTIQAKMATDNMTRDEAVKDLEQILKDEKLQLTNQPFMVLPQGTNVQQLEDSSGEENKDNKDEERSESDDTEENS